jgi:hypothetical protein
MLFALSSCQSTREQLEGDGLIEPPVSSDGNEFEVAISKNGTLYFSSARNGGLGGLPIGVSFRPGAARTITACRSGPCCGSPGDVPGVTAPQLCLGPAAGPLRGIVQRTVMHYASRLVPQPFPRPPTGSAAPQPPGCEAHAPRDRRGRIATRVAGARPRGG